MLPSKARRLSTCLLTFVGLAFGSSLQGRLERVGSRSISIRLTDRRIIDALLPNTIEPAALVAQYNIGDEVEVSTKPIQAVWEEGTSRYQSLEVTAIRLIRKPLPEELSKILSTLPFREGKNLLKLPGMAIPQPIHIDDVNAPGGKELAEARRVNLEYALHLPNFVADETAKRHRMGPRSSSWSDFDTVESEITFKGNHAARQQIKRNGKPWEQPFEALPGFKWYEGFGTEISPLFDPKCPTALEYQGHSKVSGRQSFGYRFSSPVDGCFPFFFFDYQRYNPPRNGHVFIDAQSGNILQMDEEAAGFPVEIEFSERDEEISWDYVKIGETSHLLPVRAKFLVRYYDGTRYRIEVQYNNHRHFEASTSVTFQ